MTIDLAKTETQRLAEIARLRAAITETKTIFLRHRGELATEDAALVTKRADHERECRLLALGEPHKTEATASAIAQSEARRNGLAGLIAERSAEIGRLESQHASLQQEQEQHLHSLACQAQMRKIPELAAQLSGIVDRLGKDITEFLAAYAELCGQNFLTPEARSLAIPRARASFEAADSATYRLLFAAQKIADNPEKFIGKTHQIVIEGRFV